MELNEIALQRFIFMIVRNREAWLAPGLGVRRPERKTGNEFLADDVDRDCGGDRRSRISACRNHARAKQNSGSIRKCPWGKVEADGASIGPVHQASSNNWRWAVLCADAA